MYLPTYIHSILYVACYLVIVARVHTHTATVAIYHKRSPGSYCYCYQRPNRTAGRYTTAIMASNITTCSYNRIAYRYRTTAQGCIHFCSISRGRVRNFFSCGKCYRTKKCSAITHT